MFFYIKQTYIKYGVFLSKTPYLAKLSLMVALNERYSNAWHMLIERLVYFFLDLLVVVYRWVKDNETALE